MKPFPEAIHGKIDSFPEYFLDGSEETAVTLLSERMSP